MSKFNASGKFLLKEAVYCACLYHIIFIEVPSILDPPIGKIRLKKWADRLKVILDEVTLFLNIEDNIELTKLQSDFSKNINKPDDEVRYRKKGFAAIYKQIGEHHDCATSIGLIDRIFEIISSKNCSHNFSLSKPVILVKAKSNRSSRWDEFLQLDGVRKSVKRLLNHQGWLTDEVIDFYFNLLARQREGVYSISSTCLNSAAKHFFDHLIDEDVKLILVPVHLNGNHWCLYSFSIGKREAVIRDSLHSRITEEHKQALRLIKKEIQNRLNIIGKWKTFYWKKPKQLNSNDCGIFTIANAEYVSRGVDEPNYGQSSIREFRLKILEQIKKGKIGHLVETGMSDNDLLVKYKELLDNFARDYMKINNVRQEFQKHSSPQASPIRIICPSSPDHQVGNLGVEQPQRKQQQEKLDKPKENCTQSPPIIECRRMQLLLAMNLRSIYTNEILKPIIDDKSITGGYSKVEPINADYSIKLLAIRKMRTIERILFYCKFETKDKEIKEDWLDLIVVARLKPRSIFIDFMSCIYLFGRGTYAHMISTAKKLDGNKKKKFKVKCAPLVDPMVIIPQSYRDAKERVIKQAARESSLRFKATIQPTVTMEMRRRQLENNE